MKHKRNCQMSALGWAASVPPECTCNKFFEPVVEKHCEKCDEYCWFALAHGKICPCHSPKPDNKESYHICGKDIGACKKCYKGYPLHKEEDLPQWEVEKKEDLIEAFTRVMQGEPADGGNSADDTRAYLLEFKESLLTSERTNSKEIQEYYERGQAEAYEAGKKAERERLIGEKPKTATLSFRNPDGTASHVAKMYKEDEKS